VGAVSPAPEGRMRDSEMMRSRECPMTNDKCQMNAQGPIFKRSDLPAEDLTLDIGDSLEIGVWALAIDIEGDQPWMV